MPPKGTKHRQARVLARKRPYGDRALTYAELGVLLNPRFNALALPGLAIMSGVSTKSLATDRLKVMEITKMVASHCDDTCTAFRTEPPLTKEVLDCAVTNFFPAGLGDMFSTKDGLLIVARVGIPNSAIEDYARYLTNAEKIVGKQRETDEKKRQDRLQSRADESGLPLE